MSTFKIIDQDGAVLNHIKYAASERDTDPAEVATEKRRAEALHKKQAWLTKYDPNLRLSIVECADRGYPLLDKSIALSTTKSTPKTSSRRAAP